MYEKFSDRARKVMQLANQEAQKLNHEYVGTEHILLGLVGGDANCVAMRVLKCFNITPDVVRTEIGRLIQSCTDVGVMELLPKTPKAKKVLELAREEAMELEHNYVGTEHLLLGLLREGEGLAAEVLMNLGLPSIEKVRSKVLECLGQKEDFPLLEELLAPEENAQKSSLRCANTPASLGQKAKVFAIGPGELGMDKLNDFLARIDSRDILDRLQSSSDAIVHITIFYQG